MAATSRKTPTKKASKSPASKSGAGAAIAERSKDSTKKTFGKAAPKTVKPAAAAAKTKATRKADSPSIAARVLRKVKQTAGEAVAIAGSVIGRGKASSKNPQS